MNDSSNSRLCTISEICSIGPTHERLAALEARRMTALGVQGDSGLDQGKSGVAQ